MTGQCTDGGGVVNAVAAFGTAPTEKMRLPDWACAFGMNFRVRRH
jgi:hypothetical protein